MHWRSTWKVNKQSCYSAVFIRGSVSKHALLCDLLLIAIDQLVVSPFKEYFHFSVLITDPVRVCIDSVWHWNEPVRNQRIIKDFVWQWSAYNVAGGMKRIISNLMTILRDCEDIQQTNSRTEITSKVPVDTKKLRRNPSGPPTAFGKTVMRFNTD